MSASVSSVWPLPCTPAMARISPPLTSNDTSSTSTWPVALVTVRSLTTSEVSVCCGSPLTTDSSTARPTMIAASSASVDVGEASPTTAPRRMTVILSAMARTSRSLWVMKTIAAPSSRSCFMISMSSSVSCGVSTAVGSSKTST